MPNWMIVIGCVVIGVLAVVAAFYCFKLFQQEKDRKKSEHELAQHLEERKARNINSIVVISRALIDDQVTLTEASIRINALAPTLGLADESMAELKVFQQLAEATAHIPILEKWKALSKKEKANFTLERESIEEKFNDFIKDAARKIVSEEIRLK